MRRPLVSVVALVALVILGGGRATVHAHQLPTISTAPNPCAGNSSQRIPVYTGTGDLECFTQQEYNASAPGTLNVACPQGGAYNTTTGVWMCNTQGNGPAYSQVYLECLNAGLGGPGLCDPAGFAAQLIAGFLPGVSQISKALAAAQLILKKQPSWESVCAVWSLGEPSSLTSTTQFLVDTACALAGIFGGSMSPPSIHLGTPQVSPSGSVTDNGVALPGASGSPISEIFWTVDGGQQVPKWFPATFTLSPGSHVLSATAVDANGLTATQRITVTIGSSLAPPTINLFPPQVNGLCAILNGVTLPGSSSDSIAKIIFSVGNAQTTTWFPFSFCVERYGTYNVSALAISREGATATAITNVTFTGSVSTSTAPHIDSITPARPSSWAGSQLISVAGSNFGNGLEVVETVPGGGSTVLAGATRIQNLTSTSFLLRIDFGSNHGTYSIQVVNVDGQRSNVFTFTAAPPQ